MEDKVPKEKIEETVATLMILAFSENEKKKNTDEISCDEAKKELTTKVHAHYD